MALPKRNRGIRPIAVGETLRRSISSCAMDHVSKSAAEWFNPSQLGIATSNGTESIVHAVRRVHEHHGNNSEYAILSGDLSNGFNLVNRKAFLKGVQEHFPALLARTVYCYGDDAPYLWSGEDVIRSVTGVQQDDPLVPLLFALALHPMAVELKERLQDSVE